MFQLSVQQIHIGQKAADKAAVLEQVVGALVAAGNVAPEYLAGMQAREQQTSTYLGNGIAIPHGTTDTRGQVLKTGVQVFQYPQGIAWGAGQTAYIVIGIAARSDEHLALLRQLTHILGDEDLAQPLRAATDADVLRALLMGENQTQDLIFDARTLILDVEASDLVTLQGLNAGRLHALHAVSADFVSQAVCQPPLHLGQGIWLNDSAQGNLASAIAIARMRQPFHYQGQPVSMLITVVVADKDSRPLEVLNRLSDLLTAGTAGELQHRDASWLIARLTGEAAPVTDGLSAEFIIRNEHGLHARPGTLLVNTIKQFSSEITVINLDGTGKAANGRSLMKVIALGVKKGNRLRFTAQGEDAAEALTAIGSAIDSGLGEEVA